MLLVASVLEKVTSGLPDATRAIRLTLPPSTKLGDNSALRMSFWGRTAGTYGAVRGDSAPSSSSLPYRKVTVRRREEYGRISSLGPMLNLSDE
jgi:hypothetical protein